MRRLFVTNAITDDAGNVQPGHAVAVYGSLADAQAQTGAITDLLDANQAPVTSLVADDTGNCMFYGPDGTDVLYADSGHGLIPLTAADAGPRVAALEGLVAGLSAVRFVQSQEVPEDTSVVWLYDTGESGPTSAAQWVRLTGHTDYASLNGNPVEPLEPYDNVCGAAVIERVGDTLVTAFPFYSWDIDAAGRPYTMNLRVVTASTDGTVLGTLDLEIPGGTTEYETRPEGVGQPGDVHSVWDLTDSQITMAQAGDFVYINADAYAWAGPLDGTHGRWWTLVDVSTGEPVLVDSEILYYESSPPAHWEASNMSTVIGLDSTRVLEVSSEGLTVLTVSGSGVSRGTPVFDTDMDVLYGPRVAYAGGVGFASWQQDGGTDYAYWPFTYAAGTVTLGTRTEGPFSADGTDYGSSTNNVAPYVASATPGVFYDIKTPDPVGARDTVVVKLITDGDTITLGDVSGWVESADDVHMEGQFYGGRYGHPLERNGQVDVLYARIWDGGTPQGSVYAIANDVFGSVTYSDVDIPADYPDPHCITAAWVDGGAVIVHDWNDGDTWSTSAFLTTEL